MRTFGNTGAGQVRRHGGGGHTSPASLDAAVFLGCKDSQDKDCRWATLRLTGLSEISGRETAKARPLQLVREGARLDRRVGSRYLEPRVLARTKVGTPWARAGRRPGQTTSVGSSSSDKPHTNPLARRSVLDLVRLILLSTS